MRRGARYAVSIRSGPFSFSALLAAGVLTILGGGAAQAATVLAPPAIGKPGVITYCSAINLPPMEFLSPATEPEGLDVDIGDEIAKRLGVKAAWNNVPFSGLIPAILAGQCDAIISDLFIKPERLKVLDMVPYLYSHEVVLLKAGSPKVPGLADLSGKKVATVTGTTATILLQQENAALKAAGKPPIDIVMFPENTEALQQLEFGQVDAYGVAYEPADYYMRQDPGKFALNAPPYFKILTGIAVDKKNPALNADISKTIAAMMKDGTYGKLLAKWNLQTDAVGK